MMKKSEKEPPHWIENLKALMTARNLNPRRLSIRSGLNATAVRDMLDGRARYPRYDTIEALARSLEVTPAQLMGGSPLADGSAGGDPMAQEDLNLLTEIIARLQETAEEQKQPLKPRDFAAMATTIFRTIKEKPAFKNPRADITPTINQLVTYDALRRRSGGKS